MSQNRFETWHLDLQDLLGLAVPPIAIAFTGYVPTGIDRIERTMPPPTTDGRTGTVAAMAARVRLRRAASSGSKARKACSQRRRRITATAASAA
jgi:hypothetical protein